MCTAALLLVVSLAVTSCGNGTETTDTTGFTPDTLPANMLANWNIPELGLSLQFPVDWLPNEEVENGFVGFTAQPVQGDTFIENFNVVVVDLPDDVTLAQYVRQDGLSLAAGIEGFTVTGGYQDTMAGVETTAVAFDAITNGVEISVLRLTAIVESKGLEFTFLASRDEFLNFSPVVQQIIDSIVLTG
jgi:hypothetical protein